MRCTCCICVYDYLLELQRADKNPIRDPMVLREAGTYSSPLGLRVQYNKEELAREASRC